jgi:hypothetical protein
VLCRSSGRYLEKGKSDVSSAFDPGSAVPHFEFVRNWDLSGVPEAQYAWAHSGLAVTAAGEPIGFHAGHLVAFDDVGHVLRVVSTGLTEGHGITLVQEDGEEYLWISDPGFVFVATADDGDEAWAPLFGKGVHRETREPRVVKVTLDGKIRSELPKPPTDSDMGPGIMGPYCPCGSAIDEERLGGSGDIWVADGYGSSLVHRFDKHGRHLLSLSGEEGGGRFLCPHAVLIDRRGDKAPELYIADRENRRIQVYDLDGRYQRTVGESFLNSPSGFALRGDLLVVAELYARLAVLDVEDDLVGYVGADPDAEGQGWPERAGWPNALAQDGHAVVPDLPHPDRFNSPHSVAVDADGDLYICEWLIGGRYTRLRVLP